MIASIPSGGQLAPSSTVGASALWKKAQNIATKNITSEIINNITPRFNPFWTAAVWFPNSVPSVVISLNQKAIVEITVINAM